MRKRIPLANDSGLLNHINNTNHKSLKIACACRRSDLSLNTTIDNNDNKNENNDNNNNNNDKAKSETDLSSEDLVSKKAKDNRGDEDGNFDSLFLLIICS